MPTIPDIRTSVENQNVLILDEHARNGVFEKDARGRIVAYTGGFSVVFPYKTANSEKWAFRCWHSEINNNLKKRFETISEAIKKAHLDFLCDFFYIDQGVNINGKIYPTIRMRWVEGISLKDYICQNKDSKTLLKSLAERFLQMTNDLHDKSLAHGDLQHGNILVGDNQHIYLVDYDSFYCPELKGESDIVVGLADYQHPARKDNKVVSEKLDYFSELIIYLSILAIAEKPSLVEKYNVTNADRLLFSKDDFDNIKESSIYKDIQSLGKEFQELLNVLEEYLNHKNIDELLPFQNYLLESKVIFETSTTKAIRDKQSIKIHWNVPFEADVTLRENNKDATKVANSGERSLSLNDNTVFVLSAKSKSGLKIEKNIEIKVFDECEINLTADKYYVFPSIPVKLSWEVKNAKKVWLGEEEVEMTGVKIIEPDQETTYTLSAEDEFGKKQQQIKIGMLPIPRVKAIMIPTPNIVRNTVIQTTLPKFNVSNHLPNIEIGMIKTELPIVPTFKDMGLNIELSPPVPHFTLCKIKSIFNKLLNISYGKFNK